MLVLVQSGDGPSQHGTPRLNGPWDYSAAWGVLAAAHGPQHTLTGKLGLQDLDFVYQALYSDFHKVPG